MQNYILGCVEFLQSVKCVESFLRNESCSNPGFPEPLVNSLGKVDYRSKKKRLAMRVKWWLFIHSRKDNLPEVMADSFFFHSLFNLCKNFLYAYEPECGMLTVPKLVPF